MSGHRTGVRPYKPRPDPADLAAHGADPPRLGALLYPCAARLPGGDAVPLELSAPALRSWRRRPERALRRRLGSFTALTGSHLSGEGEGDKPPHPQAGRAGVALIERACARAARRRSTTPRSRATRPAGSIFSGRNGERRGVTDWWRSTPILAASGMLDYLLGNAVAYQSSGVPNGSCGMAPTPPACTPIRSAPCRGGAHLWPLPPQWPTCWCAWRGGTAARRPSRLPGGLHAARSRCGAPARGAPPECLGTHRPC